MGNKIYKLWNQEEDDMPTNIAEKGLKYKNTEKINGGWDGVKALFQVDEYGSVNPELQRCKETILVSTLGGCLIGGVGRSRIAYQEFFRNYSHSSFETPQRARALLQEKMMIGFGSGAWRIGWRIGVFSLIYTASSTSFSAYRGKLSILDSVFGGTLAGFVYKFKDGPRMTVAGATIGGGLGLIGGCVTFLLTKLAGVTPDELLAYNRQVLIDKKKKEVEAREASRAKKEIDPDKATIEKFHAELLQDSKVKVQPNNPTSIAGNA